MALLLANRVRLGRCCGEVEIMSTRIFGYTVSPGSHCNGEACKGEELLKLIGQDEDSDLVFACVAT